MRLQGEKAMQRCVVIVVLASLAGIAPSLYAQDSQPATQPATRLVVQGIDWPAFLIFDRAVQAELKLNATQREAVRGVLDELEGDIWELRNYAPAEQATRSQALSERLQQRLQTVLSRPQQQRLAEITFQARGAAAALDPETTSRLALTERQLEQIQVAVIRTRLATQELEALVADGRQPAARELLARRIRTDERNELRRILTADQEREWAALAGKPFDLSRVKPFMFRAPELRGEQTWINSQPLTLAGLRGRVVVVHFWTFGCGNCIRNYPAYRNWQKKYAPRGVTIIGIHTPETPGERSVEKVRAKARENELEFPILVDNQRKNWEAWSNNVWPAVYLVDRQGHIRYWWYGELNWQGTTGEEQMTTRIEELLAEKP